VKGTRLKEERVFIGKLFLLAIKKPDSFLSGFFLAMDLNGDV